MEHHWKQFAAIIECPYRKRFSTNGYGDYRIDNKGIYSYESKQYCCDDDGTIFDPITGFLNGEICIAKE